MNSIYLLCFSTLLGVTFFNTLLRSFRHSQDAGLTRLGDLSPRFAKNAERWEKHWLEIVGLMTLIGGTFQITTIAAAVLIYLEMFEAFTAVAGGMILFAGVCY